MALGPTVWVEGGRKGGGDRNKGEGGEWEGWEKEGVKECIEKWSSISPKLNDSSTHIHLSIEVRHSLIIHWELVDINTIAT